jgi:hypothetical protein
MSSQDQATYWQICFTTSHKSPGRKAGNPSAGLLDLSKNRFLDLDQVAFWVFHETENGFARYLDPLKDRFLDFVQAAF